MLRVLKILKSQHCISDPVNKAWESFVFVRTLLCLFFPKKVLKKCTSFQCPARSPKLPIYKMSCLYLCAQKKYFLQSFLSGMIRDLQILKQILFCFFFYLEDVQNVENLYLSVLSLHLCLDCCWVMHAHSVQSIQRHCFQILTFFFSFFRIWAGKFQLLLKYFNL